MSFFLQEDGVSKYLQEDGVSRYLLDLQPIPTFISPPYVFTPATGQTTITGSGFDPAATVNFGGVAATGVVWNSEGSITCNIPLHAAGQVVVSVVNPGGVTGSLPASYFTYITHSVNPGSSTLRAGFQYTLLSRGNDFRRLPGVHVSTALGQQKTATITIDGRSNRPQTSEKIQVVDPIDNNRLMFAGVVERTLLKYDGDLKAYFWEVTCSGWTTLFNKYRPIGIWTNISATDFVISVVSQFAPGFTTIHVQTNLQKISIEADGTEELLTLLQRAAKLIGGGHVWIDDYQDVHFFHTVPTTIPAFDIPPQPMLVGPAAAPSVVQGVDGNVSYVPAYVGFAVSFYYANGVETMPGALSQFVSMQGQRKWQINNIAIGPIVNGQPCIGRRLYYTAFGTLGTNYQIRYADIADNVTISLSGHAYGVTYGDLHGTTFATPPGDGSFSTGVNQLSNNGWQPGDTVTIRFTALGINGGETTLGGVGASFTFGPIIPGTGSPGMPLIVAPAPLPAGTRALFIYGTRDGGATYHQITSSAGVPIVVNPGQIFQMTVTRSRFDTNSAPPATNTVELSGYVVPPAWTAPTTPYLVPPAGPKKALGIFQNTTTMTFPPPPLFIPTNSYGFSAGYFQVRYAYFYANGVISVPSPASAPLLMDGVHAFAFSNYAPGPTVDGVAVVGIIMYADYLGNVSPTQYTAGLNTMSWFEAPTSFLGIPGMGFPINLTTDPSNPYADFIWPNPDGPSLELSDAPDPINDANVSLLYQTAGQAVELDEDRTQVWNRVKIFGPGSTLTTDLLPGQTTATVADLTQYSPRGGQVIGRGQVFKYTAVSAPTGQGKLFLNASTPIAYKIPSGSAILDFFQADDTKSQAAIGAVELDKNGLKTDGVYENIIIDPTLRLPIQLFMKAYGILERYGWPVKTVRYSTDPKSVCGKMVPFDLTYPPIKGNFLIQKVDIDRIRSDGDQVAPRYTVTASSVKFELDDFLLMILDKTNASIPITGVVDAAVAITQSLTGTTLTQLKGSLTSAQVATLASVPVTILPGFTGQIIFPVSLYIYSKVTSPGASSGVNLRYHGRAQNLTNTSANWTTTGESEDYLAANSSDGGNFGAPLLGVGLDLVGAFDSGGVIGQFEYVLVYFTVTR